MKKIAILLALATVVGLAALNVFNPKAVFAAETYEIEIDRTFLGVAAVSDNIIELDAIVTNSEGVRVQKDVVYSVSGSTSSVQLIGNKMKIVSEGEFTVRAALADNAAVYDEETVISKEIEFTNISFPNVFNSLTIYTQPFEIRMIFDCNIFNDAYLGFTYEIIEGEAEVFLDTYFKAKGVGKIKIKATAIFDPDTSITKEFTIADPDANAIVDLDAKDSASGCSSSISEVAAICSAFILLAIRRKIW